MKCSICGEDLKDNQSICPNCGSVVKLQGDNIGEKNNISNEATINTRVDPVIIKAREAYKNAKFQKAKDLFDEALMNNPNSIEASFFSTLSSLQIAFEAKNIDDMMHANEMIKDSIAKIKDKYVETDPMNEYIFYACFDGLFNLFGFGTDIKMFMKNMGKFIQQNIVNQDGIRWTNFYFNTINQESTIIHVRKMFIETIYELNQENHKPFFDKLLLKGLSYGFPTQTINGREYIELYNEMSKIVYNEDPQFIINNGLTPPENFSSHKGGCYIATAIYGSYDCPEVWVLRRFRDMELATTIFGKIFIMVYYAVSPTFIRIFGHTRSFNYFWKNILDSWVEKLKAKGYDDTKYYD